MCSGTYLAASASTRRFQSAASRANAGQFVLEAALRVADERKRWCRNAVSFPGTLVVNDEPMSEKTAVEDSPLARRLADIRRCIRRYGKDR